MAMGPLMQNVFRYRAFDTYSLPQVRNRPAFPVVRVVDRVGSPGAFTNWVGPLRSLFPLTAYLGNSPRLLPALIGRNLGTFDPPRSLIGLAFLCMDCCVGQESMRAALSTLPVTLVYEPVG
jgi:hypothetical protein